MTILNGLTGTHLRLGEEDLRDVEIVLQESSAEGQPDISVRASEFAIIIENKIGAPLGETQLERYREILEGYGRKKSCLVLLTKSSVEIKGESPDSQIRWHQVAEILGTCLKDPNMQQLSVTRYVIKQFIYFMKERNMTMQQVGWEVIRGAQELMSLMDMLGKVVKSVQAAKFEKTGSFDTSGFYFNFESTRCWAGVDYSAPNLLRFEAYGIDKVRAASLKQGQIRADKDSFTWCSALDLSSEETHFFALSMVHQRESVDAFMQTNAENTRKIAGTP